MKQRHSVFRGLGLPAVLLCAISSANAQTITTVEGGQSAPKTEKEEPPEPQPPSAAQDPAEDGFTVGGFVFKPGGRIKLDIIRDFNAIGSEDFFDPRTIPVDGSESTNSQLNAKETRLFLDVRGPVEGKELKMYIEGDFYGSNGVIRLRHAYGSWGGLLAGQTWSTFVDENNFPNTIDFESPMAFPSIRQTQVRYTWKLGARASWAVAVEDNKSAIEVPANIPGNAEYPLPDLVTRFRFEGKRGHVFAAAFLGRARFRPTQGEPDDVTLRGGLVSAKLKTGGRDSAYTQITFGEGVGRYRGGVTAVPDENGRLQPVGLFAWLGGYEHYWSPRFSSNAVFSEAYSPSRTYYAADHNKQLDYVAINFLYWFLPDRAWTGVEYLYGRREVFGGQVGSANRLQFAVRFNLP